MLKSEIRSMSSLVFSEDERRLTFAGPLRPVADAGRAGASHFTAHCPPDQFDLMRANWISPWQIYHRGTPVGQLRVRWWGLNSTADLPPELPSLTRVFLFYVALMLRGNRYF